jgi:excisionase family DNA binding protein
MKARNQVDFPPSWRRELRPREAAAMIGCSQAFVYKLMKNGRFRNRALVTQGTRGIRLIDRSDVEAFLCGQGRLR